MSQPVHVATHPVFHSGVFRSHPELFRRFNQNSPQHLLARYERLWETISRHKGVITWPLISGPGFWGATHPGADTVFVDIMVGFNNYVYNSDCLYANPARGVFAISDPPGITTGSRSLFERLDRYLSLPQADLAGTIARLNEETRPEDGATLSLVQVAPGDRAASVVIAGDTLVFRGNSYAGDVRLMKGSHEFIGTPYASFGVQTVPLEPGDFFLIASDGITSLAATDRERNVTRALESHSKGALDTLVERVMKAANACYRETIYDRVFTRFGGNDNVSLLLVQPENLAHDGPVEPVILGGYIEPRG